MYTRIHQYIHIHTYAYTYTYTYILVVCVGAFIHVETTHIHPHPHTWVQSYKQKRRAELGMLEVLRGLDVEQGVSMCVFERE